MSVSVRLYLRVRRSDGSRFFAQPAFAANGRLRLHFALIDGQPRHCPGAVYYLRYAAGAGACGRTSARTRSSPLLARANELSALLRAADQDERDMLNFFLATGGRKQEVQSQYAR